MKKRQKRRKIQGREKGLRGGGNKSEKDERKKKRKRVYI